MTSTCSTTQGPWRGSPAPGSPWFPHWAGHIPPGSILECPAWSPPSWHVLVYPHTAGGREGRSHLSCPLPTEPLGEDEGDGPGDGSEAATDEDRLDSLEVPEAAEGECML